jgi:hypothetical protein
MIFTGGASGQTIDDYASKALSNTSFVWRSTASDRIKIYYEKDSFAQKHRAMLLRSAATMVDEVLELLGETEYDAVLNVFYLDSREKMERVVGRPYSGFANWGANAIFVVFNPDWRSFEKHEFAHVITMGEWGPPAPSSRWMIEGIPVFCDGWCREYSVDEIAYHFASRNALPPLREFFDDYIGLGEIRAGFYAGSFVGFIINRYGADTLRDLWSHGVEDMEAVLGSDLEQLEKSWRMYLEERLTRDVQVDIDVITDKGCG